MPPYQWLVWAAVPAYDAASGRWTAKDPLGFGGGSANLYQYACGDPINYIDPDGRTPLALAWGAVKLGLALYAAYQLYSATDAFIDRVQATNNQVQSDLNSALTGDDLAATEAALRDY